MVLNSDDRFENPEMPAWLVLNLMNYFKAKDIDCIMGCQKLWEDMLHG